MFLFAYFRRTIHSANITQNAKRRQSVLGFVEGNKFFYYFIDNGNSIVSNNTEITAKAILYLKRTLNNKLRLREVLKQVCTVISDKENLPDNYIDLSINKLTKETFLKLMV